VDDLTLEKIIEIHEEIIGKHGGLEGILNEATLEFMIYRVNRVNKVIYRSALILYCIASKHPFNDGNKRTAFLTAEIVLGQEGYHIVAEQDEIVEFMLNVAEYRFDTKGVEKWIRKRAKKSEFA
jgi:death on curing protein